MFKKLLILFYHNPLVGLLMPTLVGSLRRELADCKTVLDLGCGSDSPLQFCKKIKYSVGVEVFKPYYKETKKKKIHTKYINKHLEEVNFPPKSFDAVIMLEVLEHLPVREGLAIMKKMESWAKKKIIVSTPNGFIAQKAYDKNSYQKHLSGWNYKKMSDLGFKNYGLAGIKWLRDAREHDTKDADLTTSIRFSPKLFWFLVASLTQIVTARFPRFAFGLFSVKKIVSA